MARFMRQYPGGKGRSQLYPPVVVFYPPTQQQATVKVTQAVLPRDVFQQRRGPKGWVGRAAAIQPSPLNVVDTFQRANGAPGANWGSAASAAFPFGLTLVSNQLTTAGAGAGIGYLTPAAYQDVQVTATVGSISSAGMSVIARLRTPPASTNASFYAVRATSTTMRIEGWFGGPSVFVLATASQTVAVGDKIQIRCVGSQIEARWLSSVAGSAWKVVASVLDASWTSGYTGFQAENQASAASNFAVDILTGDLVAMTSYNIGVRPPAVVGPSLAPTQQQQTVKATFAPIPRRKTTRRLSPPTVVLAAPVFEGPSSHLAYSRRGKPRYGFIYPVVVAPGVVFKRLGVITAPSPTQGRRARSFLRPPTVVTPDVTAVVYPPVTTHLTRIKPVTTHSRLLPPAVVGAGITFRPVAGKLAYSRRGVTRSRLAPQAVLAAVFYPYPVRVTLVRGRAGRPLSQLRPPVIPPLARPVDVTFVRIRPVRTVARLAPPAVVGAGIYFYPVAVTLAYSRRGSPRSRLAPPAVVVAGFVYYPVKAALAYSRRGRTRSRLAPPIIPPTARPEVEKIAVQLAVAALRERQPHFRLFPPAVVGGAVYFYPVSTSLAYSRRGAPKSRLNPPAVVGAGLYFYPVRVTIARTRFGAPRSRLFPPVIPPLARPVDVTFARIRPPATRAKLQPPATVVAVFYYPVRVTVVRGRAGHVRPVLFPPAVVGAGVYFYPVATTLTYSRRGTPRSVLRPPIIPPLARPVEEEIAVQLVVTSLRERAAHSKLSPPTVVAPPSAFEGPIVHLTPSKRGRPVYRLAPPAVVGGGIYFYPVRVTLVRGRAGAIRSHLAPPIIPPTARPVSEEIAVQLALAELRPRASHSELRPPAVVGAGIYFYPVAVTLAPSTDIPLRRRPDSRLFPPAVVQPIGVILPAEILQLAYSRRGVPKSRLAPPAVVGAGVYFRGILVHLAPSSRGKPKSRLAPPIIPPLARPTKVTLGYGFDRRRAQHSELRAPTVVAAAAVFRPVEVVLVRGRAGKTRSELFAPTVVNAPFVASPLDVHLTYSRRGRPLSELRAPVVVFAFFIARPVEVVLVRGRAGKTRSELFSPTVVIPAALARPTQIHLSPSTRGKPRSRLAPPAVVGGGIVFRPIEVTIVRGRAGKTRSFLYPAIIPPLARPTKVVLTPSTVIGRKRIAKSVLRPPRVVRLATELTISTTLARIKPPQRFWRLSPPKVVRPYLTPVETVERVYLAALRTLNSLPARRSHFRLFPPAIIKSSQEIRVDGPPETGWATCAMDTEKVVDLPETDWTVCEPETEIETEPPEDGWDTGKPR